MPAIFGSPVLIEQPFFSPRLRHPVEFLDTHLRLDNEYAYHALALDEHREDFEATFWTRTVKKGEAGAPERTIGKVEQRWFVGAHANVGGGYASDPLSQRPLVWLMDKAAGLGTRVPRSGRHRHGSGRKTLIRSISVRLIAITVIGPVLPNRETVESDISIWANGDLLNPNEFARAGPKNPTI
jgi:hypothetical protein